jgi:6-phosphogluconolactonase
MSRTVIVVKDAETLAEDGATLFEAIVDAAIQERQRTVVALSGGSTPEKMFGILARRPVKWDQTLLFFGDERFVPLDDPVSNYGMANRTLLGPASVPSDHVFPVPVGAASADAAAVEYEAILELELGPLPSFDLILLGLGDDGHTASLFPGAAALGVTDHLVTGSPPGTLPPPVDRVTFTYPLLNAARKVVFLVSGAKKAVALRAVLEEDPPCDVRPAACVQATEVLWLLDEDAASLLSPSTVTGRP